MEFVSDDRGFGWGTMERPNFLVIMTDQHRADHLGCYGNPMVRTPVLDGLAAAGHVFDSCFVAAPMCMSNRASFMTGRMPSLHGVRHNGIPLPRSAVTFVELLRADGYATALIGKSHLQNMEDRPPLLTAREQAGRRPQAGGTGARKESLAGSEYDQERPSRWRDPAHRIETPFYGFDHVELANDHGDLVYGDYERWAAARDPEVLNRRGPDGALPANDIVAPQAWRTSVPEELYPSAFVADRAKAWLGEHAATNADEPFFLMCSFPDPHHPFTPPGDYWALHDPADVTLPATFRSDGEGGTGMLAWLHAERAAGKAPVNAHRVFALGEAEARQAIALTYGMIAMVDAMVGRILDTLDELGMARNTVVVFTSDHGDFMGDHGLLLKGPLHYRGLIRVPLIWCDPSIAGTWRYDSLVSTIDIPETILDRAGVASPHGMQGRSFLPLMRGDGALSRDAVLVEDATQRAFLGFDQPVRVRTVVTRDARLSLYGEGGVGELYDLVDDPHETRDLWADPSRSGKRAAMTETMTRQMLDLADEWPLPTGIA